MRSYDPIVILLILTNYQKKRNASKKISLYHFLSYAILVTLLIFAATRLVRQVVEVAIPSIIFTQSFRSFSATDISRSRREEKDKSYHHSDISVNYMPCELQICRDDREILVLYEGRHIEKQNLMFHQHEKRMFHKAENDFIFNII